VFGPAPVRPPALLAALSGPAEPLPVHVCRLMSWR
jgi:hypothetical protein